MDEKQTKNNYDILDLSKFFLSLMVVAIHTSLLPKYLYPWLRIAVPMFFMISSFLLSNKIINSRKEEKWKIIRKYIKRLLLYYLFWFIVLLPFTIDLRKEWFKPGVMDGIKTSIRCLFFSSTFVASWYISATIFATLIVYKLSEKINKYVLLVFYAIIFFACCIISSYSFLYKDIEIVKKIVIRFSEIIAIPYFSFPVALVFVHMGKLFSENKTKILNYSSKVYIIPTIIFAILLYIEWKYVYNKTKAVTNDCYFSLLPLAVSLFALVRGIKINLRNPKLLRIVSNITYPMHGSIAFYIRDHMPEYIKRESFKGIFNFVVTITIVYICCFLIIKLENKKFFKILKYSH